MDEAARPVTRRRVMPRPTDRITLGKTRVEVSPFCLGWVDDPDTVLAAFDIGINFFFVPTDYHLGLYMRSIEGLKRLLARGGGIRDEIVVAAVGYIENPDFFGGTFRELLYAAPEIDRLDVAIAGAVLPGNAGRIEQLHALRSEERLAVNAVGASFHSRPEASAAIAAERIDVAFVRYNPLHPGAREDLFPAVVPERNVRLFNFVNSAGYLDDEAWSALDIEPEIWRPELSDYYRFALTRPELDGILCAPKFPAHVERILRAVEAGPLTSEEEEHMIDLALLGTGQATLAPTDTEVLA